MKVTRILGRKKVLDIASFDDLIGFDFSAEILTNNFIHNLKKNVLEVHIKKHTKLITVYMNAESCLIYV